MVISPVYSSKASKGIGFTKPSTRRRVLESVNPINVIYTKTTSKYPRQTCRREDRHIVRNARVKPTASSAAIHAQVTPSPGAPVSSQTIRRRLAEGHLGSRHPSRAALDAHPSKPPFEWLRARGN
ncbi:transposable element Tcb2 transposase [Trichonephila clavipes]|nr:transposable element Tcb2 transposase [Trichonephila clavipes]